MKLELNVALKSFKTDDGREIQYFSYQSRIGDTTFTFVPKAEDKKLLNYLLNEALEQSGEINDEV